MKWRRVDKAGKTLPAHGASYRDWKEDLAAEGFEQCVYCSIPERNFGGKYNFHVEHFEPKSLAPARINEWANLFYSCAICNVFKRGNYQVFIPRLIKEHGLDWWWTKVKGSKRTVYWTRADLIERIRSYQERLEKL